MADAAASIVPAESRHVTFEFCEESARDYSSDGSEDDEQDKDFHVHFLLIFGPFSIGKRGGIAVRYKGNEHPVIANLGGWECGSGVSSTHFPVPYCDTIAQS